jgi:hypothetical protein
MPTKFYPMPFGHVEVRVDRRPAPGACPQSGPVDGVWGNREVPPADLDHSRRRP